MNSQNVSADVLQKFLEIINDNIARCELFSSQLVQHYFPEAGVADLARYAQILNEDQFILGLVKYIMHVAQEKTLIATLKSVYTYRVYHGSPQDDLVSLSIELSPNEQMKKDTYELALFHNIAQTFSAECHAAELVPVLVSTRILVDEVLKNDVAIRDTCISEMAKLLSDTGYDVTNFPDWVAQIEAPRAIDDTMGSIGSRLNANSESQ